jgi:adenine-specific DNA-methyltransferase
MMLNKPYNKELFFSFLKAFLPDFKPDERKVRTSDKSILKEVLQLGKSKDVNVTILEAKCEKIDSNKRIAITQAAFKILRDHSIRNAIIAFFDGGDQWRISLLTSKLEINEGQVLIKNSNPRRYSYLLGFKTKTVTPYKYLIEKGPVTNFEQLKERFSVEAVNKEFYESIADLFSKLIGGNRGETKYRGLLKINGSISQNIEHQEFAVRLIGRLIFCWFLKEKKSATSVPIVPNELLSIDAVEKNFDYYHSILEPLFFELLNKRVALRHEKLRISPFSTVPYLNGGLFSPQYGDFYKQNSFSGVGTPGLTHIPDEWFKELFGVLERYNFTVDENTSYDVDLSIDPEMLGRVFENLLAEINPETGESARKNTGSFYTPREIVDFMVDISLLEFLKTKTKINTAKLKALLTWGQDDDVNHPLSENEKEIIVSALANLTILDPACGSGAFPIGILQKVVYVLQQVDKNASLWIKNQLRTITSPEHKLEIELKYRNENYDYLRKLGVIRASIFGVDIQTIATEISKLRCFLTLIIEENIEDNAYNRGIQPLPNLEFKFITANSVLSLPESGHNLKSKEISINLFDEKSHIDRLKEIRNEYFIADTEERTRLRDEFKDLQLSMVRRARDFVGETSKLYNILSDWNPFNNEKTDWFDSEWMFGNLNFDIVIANPPYIGEKGSRDIFDGLKKSNLGKRFYNGKMDLFYFFFHLGLDNLKEEGILTFITTNYYPTADSAIKLRKDIYERSNIVKLINFGDITVFDSARGQHNLITVLQRSDIPDKDFTSEVIVSNTKGKVSSGALTNLLFGESELVNLISAKKHQLFDSIDDKFYIRFLSTNQNVEDILGKLIKFDKVSDFFDVNQGIISGADKLTKAHLSKFPSINGKIGDGIFVNKKGHLQKFNLDSSLIKPFFKNSDIKKWKVVNNSSFEIFYPNKSVKISNDFFTYISSYKPLLESRREFVGGHRPFFDLHRKRDQLIFESEKIISPQRSTKNTFAYNDKPFYASADVYFITKKDSSKFDLFSLLGILNSKLIYFWLFNRGKRKGSMLELYRTPLLEIPLPSLSNIFLAEISALSREIYEKYDEKKVIEINNLVFKAYGINEKDSELITNFYNTNIK